MLTPHLFLDGKEIPADRIGFTMKDPKSGMTIYSYIGVDFGKQGKHTLLSSGGPVRQCPLQPVRN